MNDGATRPREDLRAALARLDETGDLLRVPAEMNQDFELSAALWKLSDGPTVLFENVRGQDVPVVGNLLNRRDKLARVLGIPIEELHERTLRALQHPVEPATVDRASAPVFEREWELDDLFERLPIPTISERDSGRYISAGVLVTRDPETKRQNFAICRLEVQGSSQLGVYMAPTHSRRFFEAHRLAGSKMPVAIVVGLHPGILAATQYLTDLDESWIAGGLMGAPIHLAPARTVDIDVPAAAEFVFEGEIDPEEMRDEGPFGEFPGTYAPRRSNPVVRLTAASSRTEPIFQMVVGGRHPEHLITGAIAREAGLLASLRAVVPGVGSVILPEGGTCRFHAVVAMSKRFAGEGKLAITRVFSEQDLIKRVVVVDDDIDPSDPVQVEWALATRVRWDEDLVMISGAKSNPVDPMSEGGTVTKIGIDATLPMGVDREAPATVPRETMRRIEARWGEIVGFEGVDR